MNAKAFVDTNILVYAHDRAAGEKHERARSLVEDLWKDGGGVLSTQVLQEFCVTLRRKVLRPQPVAEIRSLVEGYANWEVVVNTPMSVLEALRIEANYQISFWDALIIQAAESSGAAVLYSEDFSDGQTYGAVRVVNPFHETA